MAIIVPRAFLKLLPLEKGKRLNKLALRLSNP